MPRRVTRHSTGANESSSSTWTEAEDRILRDARSRGLNWDPIADTYFPGRSGNACRKRHERIMDQANRAEYDYGARLEIMAGEYYQCREEMWTILADRLGERWETVEAKCMQHGLKNLRAANPRRRAGARRIGPLTSPTVGVGGGGSSPDSGIDMNDPDCQWGGEPQYRTAAAYGAHLTVPPSAYAQPQYYAPGPVAAPPPAPTPHYRTQVVGPRTTAHLQQQQRGPTIESMLSGPQHSSAALYGAGWPAHSPRH